LSCSTLTNDVKKRHGVAPAIAPAGGFVLLGI